MQAGLVQHYFTEALENWLKMLSEKFPMSPLNTILTNYLYFPHDTSALGHTRLQVAAAELYNTIKVFEDIPEEFAWEEVKNDTEINEQNQSV